MRSDPSTPSDGSRRQLPTTMFVDIGPTGWPDSVTFGEGGADLPAVIVVRVPVSDGHRWLEERLSSGGRAPVTESERRRADRMLDGHDARAHLVGRAVVRKTLTGVAQQVASVSLSRDDRGRPIAQGSRLDFNITHAGEWVVVGFSSSKAAGRVGVDLEKVGRRTSKSRQINLAGEILNDRERAWVERVAERRAEGGRGACREIYEAALMHLWTVKEAALKQTGRGLRQDPRAVGCRFRDGGRPGVAGISGCVEKYCTGEDDVTPRGQALAGLSVESFAVGDRHLGAVVHSRSAPVRFVAFDAWKRSVSSELSLG